MMNIFKKLFIKTENRYTNPYHQKRDLEKSLEEITHPINVVITISLSTLIGMYGGGWLTNNITKYVLENPYFYKEYSTEFALTYAAIGVIGGNVYLGRKIYKLKKKIKNIEEKLS